ncbi:hypothetical protein [uncultured Hymenobacter sp.]|uniref:hypothetical protein n=1 Tax=uncultured Hymenobacter sp. TaxID=170016 RepID=UPI0035CACE3F
MLALKRFVTVVVMVYLLLALLFFLVPSVRATVAGLSPGLSGLEQERQFFYWLAAIGAGILALHLLTENADSVMLRRQVAQHEGKVNELKAKLYDQQQQVVRPASTIPRPVETTTTTVVQPVETVVRPVETVRPAEAAPTPGSGFTISANPDAIPRTNPYNNPGPGSTNPAAERPVFPQSDPSLSNTPPADRPAL